MLRCVLLQAPVAAIVVASSDAAPVVRFLASLGVHRCALLNEDGSLAISASIEADLSQVTGAKAPYL